MYKQPMAMNPKQLLWIGGGGIIVAIIAWILVNLFRPIPLCCIDVGGSQSKVRTVRPIGLLISPHGLAAIQGKFIAPGGQVALSKWEIVWLVVKGKLGPTFYGPDDRNDLLTKPTNAATAGAKDNMRSTALLVNDQALKPHNNGWELDSLTLKSQGVCRCEKFSSQPTTSRDVPCTAFVLDETHVATASHCIPDTERLVDRRFILGFYVQPDGKPPLVFDKKHVLSPKDVAYRSNPCGPNSTRADVVIVQLQEKIDATIYLPVKRSTATLKRGDNVYLLGHPLGLPTKYAPNAKVRKNDVSSAYFIANIDGYDGNSGSPIFNSRHDVVGMHVRGVLSLSKPLLTGVCEDCWNSTWCPSSGCKGEEVTRIDWIPEPSTLYDQNGNLKVKPPPTAQCR